MAGESSSTVQVRAVLLCRMSMISGFAPRSRSKSTVFGLRSQQAQMTLAPWALTPFSSNALTTIPWAVKGAICSDVKHLLLTSMSAPCSRSI